MGLSVSICSPTRRLTRVETVIDELALTLSSAEKLTLGKVIDGITSAIEGFCNAPAFGRETVTETLPGYDELTVDLTRRPIIAITSMSIDSSTITDYSIQDADAGEVYRQAGFGWTAQTRFSLSGRQRWPAYGHPAPGREEPLISATYVGGYILPEQFLLSVGTIAAASGDQSFNSSTAGFPSQLKAGDLVITEGFSNPANNGRFVVSGTPTTSKIVVSGAALVTEAEAAGRTMRFDAPASCRSFFGLERAAIIAAKSAWLVAKDDPSIVERQVGQLRTRRSEGFNLDPTFPLPGEAIGFLRPWVRSE